MTTIGDLIKRGVISEETVVSSRRFDAAVAWIKGHWGLHLYRADPNARGRRSSEWRTGYVVSGSFPGYKHSWRRYGTLREIERVFGVPDADAARKEHP